MKSTVAIADSIDIKKAVNAALDLFGGLKELFEDRHVAIKPNDTWASPEDLTACTQADTIRAVVRYIKKHNPKKITVTGGAGAGETDKIFHYLGIDRVIREEGVEFFDHNRPPFKSVPLEYGPQKEVMVNERILEYETLVSLAQLKVHELATVTLTMKNIAMSFPAADYYGHPRSKYLKTHNFFKDIQGFIAGMCRRFPTDLGIIVGHPAMIGKGPVGGRVFESGLVIASRDFVAADYIGARILGFKAVEHITEAAQLGLGAADMDKIGIAGVSLEEAQLRFQQRSRGAVPSGKRVAV